MILLLIKTLQRRINQKLDAEGSYEKMPTAANAFEREWRLANARLLVLTVPIALRRKYYSGSSEEG